MKNYKYLPIVTGLFTAVLLISNILDVKIFKVFDFGFLAFDSFNLPAGVILFPIAYVFGDLLTEVYGYSTSRKVIWTGFGALLLFIVFSQLAILLPAGEGWNLHETYNTMLTHVPRIIIASITAYFVGEFTNSFILAKMKVKTEGKGMASRFVVSTIFGEFVDPAVFVLIAYAGQMPLYILISILVPAWLFKVAWEVIALPLSIPLVKWLKRVENEDYFDKNTNFNPFKLNDKQ
jgi:uncharacterized integral membrane protein (TIGR00697 family)